MPLVSLFCISGYNPVLLHLMLKLYQLGPLGVLSVHLCSLSVQFLCFLSVSFGSTSLFSGTAERSRLILRVCCPALGSAFLPGVLVLSSGAQHQEPWSRGCSHSLWSSPGVCPRAGFTSQATCLLFYQTFHTLAQTWFL